MKRKQAIERKAYDKEAYLGSIARINNAQAKEINDDKEKHEGTLRRLESLEARMVTDLQRTLMKKNVAFDKLQ